ncbi:DUF3775 domain-containing protein [Mesorhizobium sp. NBSH29]|uniref:DUF3775 domain-containing protein n=1 Tax=Mesorhizobium sp. NBSH29 TaxID=2654249 RepID=UPI0018967195|nr:DUF3775 domain-containing protein [Mesorhizobium sp. NBSH29]QPC88389.1 DUF3775 domain-containing protein [Mesorhizobium sp. NBSH29]
MRTKPEKEWDLTIDPETVRFFILKAKAISAAMTDDYDDGHEHEVELDSQSRDGHRHDGLAEEEEEDLTEEELRELINDLNVDEAAELIALAWLGRGDYDRTEWTQAVADARPRVNKRVAKYLLGMPTLGAWLEEGLETLGA